MVHVTPARHLLHMKLFILLKTDSTLFIEVPITSHSRKYNGKGKTLCLPRRLIQRRELKTQTFQVAIAISPPYVGLAMNMEKI
jgi:hypothetical protein